MAHKSNSSKIVRRVLCIAAILLLILNACFHFLGFITWNASLGYIALLILLFGLLDVNSIVEISAGGFMLKRKLEEVDSAMEHLRGLITPIAQIAISTAVRSGRMTQVIEHETLMDLKSKIESELKKIYPIEIQEQKLSEVFHEYHQYQLFDLASPVFKAMKKTLDDRIREIEKKLGSYKQPITQDDMFQALSKIKSKAYGFKNKLKKYQQNLDFSNFKERINNILEEWVQYEILDVEMRKKLYSSIEANLKTIEYYKEHKAFFNETIE